MAELTANAVQTVPYGQNFIYTEVPVPCRKGYVLHRPGSGIVTLRGNGANTCCNQRATYNVRFDSNIAIAEGGTAGEIGVSITVDGEALPVSTAVITPAAVGDFWHVSVEAEIAVPSCCCYVVAVENTSTTSQPVDGRNTRLSVHRVA